MLNWAHLTDIVQLLDERKSLQVFYFIYLVFDNT